MQFIQYTTQSLTSFNILGSSEFVLMPEWSTLTRRQWNVVSNEVIMREHILQDKNVLLQYRMWHVFTCQPSIISTPHKHQAHVRFVMSLPSWRSVSGITHTSSECSTLADKTHKVKGTILERMRPKTKKIHKRIPEAVNKP